MIIFNENKKIKEAAARWTINELINWINAVFSANNVVQLTIPGVGAVSMESIEISKSKWIIGEGYSYSIKIALQDILKIEKDVSKIYVTVKSHYTNTVLILKAL
jgi:hypothetical protein